MAATLQVLIHMEGTLMIHRKSIRFFRIKVHNLSDGIFSGIFVKIPKSSQSSNIALKNKGHVRLGLGK